MSKKLVAFCIIYLPTFEADKHYSWQLFFLFICSFLYSVQPHTTLGLGTVKERTNLKELRKQEWHVMAIQKLPQWNQTTDLNQALWKKEIFYYMYNEKILLFDLNLFSAPNLFSKRWFYPSQNSKSKQYNTIKWIHPRLIRKFSLCTPAILLVHQTNFSNIYTWI